MVNRRAFLRGLLATVAAPAVAVDTARVVIVDTFAACFQGTHDAGAWAADFVGHSLSVRDIQRAKAVLAANGVPSFADGCYALLTSPGAARALEFGKRGVPWLQNQTTPQSALSRRRKDSRSWTPSARQFRVS